jgi:predicted HNH restriction endonuclease
MHFVTHRTREKKRREAKLTEVKNAKGKLCCEAPGCGFDFFATYGEVGEDYIHVHHIKPLASRLAPEKTPLADLVLVCANCHAMIHRGGQCRPLQGLLTKTTAKKAPPIAKRPTSR